jgi:uncharacterized protein (TIGR03435 family)
MKLIAKARTAILVLAGPAIWAQPPAPDARPVFEVAAVKPAVSGLNGWSGGCHGSDSAVAANGRSSPQGRCSIRDARLSHMISLAYGVQKIDHIEGAPVWAISGDERFDVEAKASDPTATEAQLLQMLQRLLEERFRLKYKWEEIDVSGSALVVRANEAKVRPSAGGKEQFQIGPSPKPGPNDPVKIMARNQPIERLAEFLNWLSPDPVTDDTGLKGNYDFDLSWDETNGPSLSTALRQQLGLRMEKRKVHQRHFLFASAEHPTGN